jgi:hypothetical protein
MAEESSTTAELKPDTQQPPVAEKTAVEPTTTTTADEKPASPSEAPKGETKETLLEAVTRAVKPADDEDEKPEPSPSSEGAKAGAGAESERTKPDLSKDPTPEELAGYKEATRERIQALLGERNSFRAEAEVTRTLRDFLVTNDIAREDFQLTLDLAAAMRRGDFQAFLEGVGPYVQLATQALGVTLPPDLAGEVQHGRMTFDAASQVSRERYARALAEQRSQRATQVLSSQQSLQQQQHLAQSIETSVASWENGVRATDPDYARKEETVRNFLWAVVRERGAPQTPEHAVQIAQEAYRRANDTLRQWTPPPRPTRSVPSSINRSASAGTRDQPKSMMEAAMLGLERARGG